MKIVLSRLSRFSRSLSPLIFLALVFNTAAAAQTARAVAAAQTALTSEFDVNGLRVIVKRRPGSATVAAGLFIRGGARNLTAQNAGIEEFALNVVTEGSQNFPRETLRRELARTGSNISSGANYDYSVLALASTLENFDRSWEIFSDVVVNPAFAVTDVDLTREKTLTSLRDDEDDPDGFLQVLIQKTIYAGSSYANSPDGTIENIGRLKADDLRSYYKRSLQSSQLLLVIVGDLDPVVLKQRVAASFGKLPRGSYKASPVVGIDFSRPTLDITPRRLPTNYIQGTFAAPSLMDSDFYAMRVATTILRDRVFEEVRAKRNLSYAPSADMGSLGMNTGNIYVTAVDANQAIRVMLSEIDELKVTPVGDRDISGVAGQFLTTYFIGQETNAAQAAELARYEITGGGWQNASEFLARIKQVTPADVQRVAKKYMKNLRFVVIGDPNSIDRNIFLATQ